MSENKIGRREFLRLAAMSAAGAGIVACQPQTVVVKETVEVEKVVKETVEVEKEVQVTTVVEKEVEVTKIVETEKVVEVAGVSSKQAPDLQQMVKDGKIPSLDERLPKSPKVLSKARNEVPVGELDFTVGSYGGTIRTTQPSPTWQPDIFVGNDEPLCAAPGILADGIGGGVAESFEVSDGGKVFTFHLRPGLKWSDGEPVTTDDVRFMYEDVLSNELLTPTFPAWMKTGNSAGGDPLVVEIVDDYTFTVNFTESYAGFAAFLAILQWKGYTELMKPKHFLVQFHADYTPLADLEPLIKDQSLAEGEWWTLFWSKNANNWDLCNPKAVGFPNLQPWYVIEVGDTYSKYERNPYYFKIDEEGNQLPYINDIVSAVVADVEMSQLKVIAGEVDFLREDATLDNFALYNENADKGGYRIQLLDMHVSPTDVCINQTIDDPTWRLVAQDVRFRRALSLATDRETIIDAIYFGYAKLPELSPSDYDPDEAERLLDEMGMTERGADGFRLAPDGNPFEVPFIVSMDASDIVPVCEMIVENYKEVGINASMKVLEGTLRGERSAANEMHARVRWNHFPELWWGALWDANPAEWGRLWNTWLATNGESGEEPPEDVKEFMNLVNRSIVVDGQAREEAIAAWKKMMYDNVYVIVTVERVKYPLVVNKGLRNVPTSGFAISANFSLEQMYYEA
jgi:peptide/nickel transport system substrate-binding protein